MSIRGNMAESMRRDVRPTTVSVNEGPNMSSGLKFGIVCAVGGDKDGRGKQVALSSEEPLTAAIETVCKEWGFKDPQLFALKSNESQGKYITEEMRESLVGKVLNLALSPDKVLMDIEQRLSHPNTMEQGLKDLIEISYDPVIVDTFVARTQQNVGLKLLTKIISTDVLGHQEIALSNAYHALTLVAANSNMPCWDLIPVTVYQKTIYHVNNTQKPVEKRYPLLLVKAYSFLEYAIAAGKVFSQIENELTFSTIIYNLNHPDQAVHLGALALLNAIMEEAEGSTRFKYECELSAQCYRELIFNVTHGVWPKPNYQIRRQLYKLQCYRLRSINSRKNTPVDPEDEDAILKLIEITYTASGKEWSIGSKDSMRKSDKPDKARDYQKFGFENVSNPIMDFVQVPPGTLALDCMHYLAKEQPEVYKTIILESSVLQGVAEACPFAKSSIKLASVLCDVLHIGVGPIGSIEGKYWPFIFKQSKPFEELFCICAQLVTKTWREMRATAEDFDKVFHIVRDQIQRSLKDLPEYSMDSNDFRKLVNSYTYSRILELQDEEGDIKFYVYEQAKPIRELRDYLIPNMTEHVKQNRLNYLMKGTKFIRNTPGKVVIAKATDRFWFCYLAPTGTALHYGDYDEGTDSFNNENIIQVNVIESLLIGNNCPHSKEIKKTNLDLAFSIVIGTNPLKTLDFVAPGKKEFNLWIDGINALIGRPMVSRQAEIDIGILLDMEMKIRRLDIELIPDLPEDPPPIPLPPADLDFSTFL